MSDINNRMDRDVPKFITADCECLSMCNIQKLVQKLKAGKHDGNNGIVSDCLLNGSNKLFIFLTLLFKMIIVHGYVPKDLLIGTMFPLPKVKGLTTQSDKFRAITLSGCVLKLLDLLILSEETEVMKTDELQYGFKEKKINWIMLFHFL